MSTASDSSRQAIRPPVIKPGSGNAIIVNPCQRLNPILECIRNVSKEFGDIVPDFQLGRTTCALFLSLKYHRLHPEYIHQRIMKLGNMFNLRILLLMCDISEHQEPIRELTKICLINNITVMVCWSAEEAGMYLSTYKQFEHKSADLIKERLDKDYRTVLRSALTSINKVNKMDVETLRTSFGSFANIAKANPEQLRNLPGFGQVKVRRIKDAFEKPFRNKSTSAISSTQRNLGEVDINADIAASTSLLSHQSSATKEQTIMTSKDVIDSVEPARPGRRMGSAADMPPPPVPSRPPVREPSPPWDIELDLNDDMDSPSADPPAISKEAKNTKPSELSNKQATERYISPVWDIELDLND